MSVRDPHQPAEGPAEGPAGAAPVRLQKVLARAGLASRRHAEELIRAGRVAVNGRAVSQLGTRVDPERDEIAVDGIRIRTDQPHVYLALNKPPGYITTTSDPHGRPTALDLVPPAPGLFPVGRLDAETAGLLLLTTDGDWAQRVSHPRHGCTKEYIAEVQGRPAASTLAELRRPMALDDEWTTGAGVRVDSLAPDRSLLRITLHEGRNRQIRRMMERVGHPVLSLVRVRVGAVHLGDLRPGEFRHLAHREVAETVRPEGAPPGPAAAAQQRPSRQFPKSLKL